MAFPSLLARLNSQAARKGLAERRRDSLRPLGNEWAPPPKSAGGRVFVSVATLKASSHVLISGATGLIGGEIAQLIGGARPGKVWALIRPRPDADPASRWRTRLRRSGIPAPRLSSSIESVAGDVTRARWGMTNDAFERISKSVDVIIHCAADTSFVRQESVRATNIAGVKNLISLARRCPRLSLIVYVSTAMNVGKVANQVLAEDDGCRPEGEHFNEYTRSKATAESMLRDSGLPVLILRPSIVLSAGLPDAEFARMILWFVPLARRFDGLPIDPSSRLDVVPVSYVAESAVELMKKGDRRHGCYHLSAGVRDAVTVGELADFVDRFYRRRTRLRLVPTCEWTSGHAEQYIRTKLQRKIFYGIRYYMPFLNMDAVFDNTRLRRELGQSLPPIPPVTESMGELLKRITLRSALSRVGQR